MKNYLLVVSNNLRKMFSKSILPFFHACKLQSSESEEFSQNERLIKPGKKVLRSREVRIFDS